MQFTDAVTVVEKRRHVNSDLVASVADAPVADRDREACCRALERFARDNGYPAPVSATWRAQSDLITFVAEFDGREAGISALRI